MLAAYLLQNLAQRVVLHFSFVVGFVEAFAVVEQVFQGRIEGAEQLGVVGPVRMSPIWRELCSAELAPICGNLGSTN